MMVHANSLFHDAAIMVMVHPHMVVVGSGSCGGHRDAGQGKRDGR